MANGYHELDMIMIPLELHDSILINELASSVDNYITVDDFSLIGEKNNIVAKAIDCFDKKYKLPKKVEVDIHKKIPIRAGLGGGSSNAGNMLVALNEMYKIGAKIEDLEEIGKKIGADVPFFLRETPCRCQGIGDIMTPIKVKNTYYCILVCPKEGCSTEEVYKDLDNFNCNNGNIDNVIKALEDGDDDLLASSIHNDLEPVSINLVPEIEIIKSKLKALGFKIVMMTGSGSCVFGLTTDKQLIKLAEKELENKYRIEVTKTRK